MRFGIFMAPFHTVGENPTLALERDLELIQWLDQLGYDEAWVGEHHSGGWETIASPELFLAFVAERTRNIRLGTGVVSLPYHHPLMVANRMVLLDHLARGRVMMGVGPGALVSDAYMLGIDPPTQRARMDESLGVIMQLLTSPDPVTCRSEWFTLVEGRLHLRPYTQPHFPIAVAAVASPSGMIVAGKHGAGVLSIAANSGDRIKTKLSEFWAIAEETAAKSGKKMNRADWRLVTHAHIAETRKEAVEQARVAAGAYQRGYFEQVMGQDAYIDGPADKIIDAKVERGEWVVGTPDDMVAAIKRLDAESGGFGALLIQATEWGTREQVRRSYELIARHVMPQFQGSLENIVASRDWAASKKDEMKALKDRAINKAKQEYKGS